MTSRRIAPVQRIVRTSRLPDRYDHGRVRPGFQTEGHEPMDRRPARIPDPPVAQPLSRETKMSTRMNRQIVLAARPHGEPKESDFRLVETPVPEPGPGQMLLRTLYLSLDPYMRGRMSAGPSYAAATEIGEVMGGARSAGSKPPISRISRSAISSKPIPAGRSMRYPTGAASASSIRSSRPSRRRWAYWGCRA